ncbi:ribosome biogenesis protein NOP53-like [Xenia sp. Carnegie-2017]|uniref:ribosome biogenesis protein NOP53-like n=1 Tax=Xenia sp. Carnegie-2017 TaxID=2897299 RepID=UPI001F050119|nr:ribosome biogenesis protein NOP53-like [Xenia sp. Carnegie-2017]XP_046849457.1 ribosome biogenesis protein NOP53-like [Xenia sp. Carnegie-2017]XP_046849458.1 ribosome biogenesis protein NOP53-like [Xenia sp. Carnegie-2017]
MESKINANNNPLRTKIKRKRVSKKSKRSWRKHIDIKEIEDYLDEVRRQERTGGVISQKKNGELFYMDRDHSGTEIGEKEETKQYRKGVKLRKSKQKLKKDGKDVDSSEDDEATAILPQKILKKKEAKLEIYDLWGDSGVLSKSKSFEDEHYMKVTQKKPAKQPRTVYKVRSTMPALSVCHPGASYNPTFNDHQALLFAACQVELFKEKEIKKLQRQLQFPSEEEMTKLPSWEEEMQQGLFGDESNAECSDDNDDKECGVMLPCFSGKERKTIKERQKAKERKKEELYFKIQRDEKAKENEVFRVKSIKKELKKSKEKMQERLKKKEEKILKSSSKPKRLGRQKFEEMNIEIQLMDELKGSLRNLKPEGNLFEDRFKSFQRRNIIEPRRPIMPHRKYKLKEYEKRSYKNFDIQEKSKEQRKRR